MRPLSIYIHIPFCKSKCSYCAFSSFAMGEEVYPVYIEALLKEIRTVISQHDRNQHLESIFFGGGTPSLLDPHHIEMILKEIDKELEITIEANPDTVDEKKIAAYQALGINRMSFGVQSFKKEDMAGVNRNYDPKIIPGIIKLASKYIGNVSLDLIFGLPKQTPTAWKENLKKAISLPINHLSTYELMYEEGTLMTQTQDTLKKPSEKNILKMYEINDAYLPEQGFKHYEISNWYRGAPCKHNLLFWKGQNYLGFGLSAESYMEGTSIIQTKNLKSYLENPVSHRKIEVLNTETQEYLYLQNRLRLLEEGIDIEIFEKLFGASERQALEIQLKKLPDFIEKRGYRYILKKEKCMLLDEVIKIATSLQTPAPVYHPEFSSDPVPDMFVSSSQ